MVTHDGSQGSWSLTEMHFLGKKSPFFQNIKFCMLIKPNFAVDNISLYFFEVVSTFTFDKYHLQQPWWIFTWIEFGAPGLALPATNDGSCAWFPYGWPGGGVRYAFKPGIVLKDASGYKLQENVHFTQLDNRQNPLTWTFLKGQISVPPENRQKLNLPKYSLVTYHWTRNFTRNRNLIISIVQIPV